MPVGAGIASHLGVLFTLTDVAVSDQIQRAVEATMSWIAQTGAQLGGVINCAGVGGRGLVSIYSITKDHPLSLP
jgi:NAD(P)-dependent dehydrogenase (short-subunit alcohol dehydrogenase family)